MENKNKFNCEFEGLTYEQIANELHMELFGKLPEEGSRHTQYLRVASHMRSICDNNAEWLFQIMPRHEWDEVEDMQRICKDVTKDPARGQTQELKTVLNRLHQLKEGGKKKAEPIYITLFRELEVKGWPIGYKECLKGVPEESDRLIALICITSAMTTFIDHIKYHYASGGNPDRCVLQVAVCGKSGSGKSVFSNAVQPLADILAEMDSENLKQIQAYNRLSKREQEQTPRPELPLRLGFSNVTPASLRQLIFNSQKHTTWFTSTEASSLNIGEVQDILCKAYDGQMVDSFRATEKGVSGRNNAYISYMITGTEDQIFDALYGGNRSQNGISDRVIPCIWEPREDQGIPWYESRDEEDERQIRLAVEKLMATREGELELVELKLSIRRWVAEKIQLAKSLKEDEKDIVLSMKNRSAVNGYRAAIPYLLLTDDMESATKVMLMVAEYCFQMRYRMWKTWYRPEKRIASPLNASIAEGQVSRTNDSLLKKELGEYFISIDLKQHLGSKNAADQQIRRWKDKNYIEDSGRTMKQITKDEKTGKERNGNFKVYHNLLFIHE